MRKLTYMVTRDVMGLTCHIDILVSSKSPPICREALTNGGTIYTQFYFSHAFSISGVRLNESKIIKK